MIRHCIILTLITFTAFSLTARLSETYRQWASSPQGLFMTPAERAEWGAIDDDAAAQKFISDFLARRGGEFAAEVAKRAEMADKYLTVGKTAGSKSLRGRAVILLGPPAAMDVAQSSEGEGHRIAVADTIPRTTSGDWDRKISDDVRSSVTNLSSIRALRTYTLTFRNDIARHLDKSEIVIRVVADANTGRDQLASQGDAREVEKIFEAAAEASIVRPGR